jgi:Bacterial Ig domain
MRVVCSRSILGVTLTVGAVLLVGQAAFAAPPDPIPMPITVVDPSPVPGGSGGLPFTKDEGWDFDVDDNDYEATLTANGYMQDATGNAKWSALAIQCETVTLPTKGTLTLITGPGKGSKCDWTYKPGATWNGTDTMTYRVEYQPIGGGARVFTAAETVNISGPTLPAPTLVPDTVGFTSGTAWNFDVDDNDYETTLTGGGWTVGTQQATAMWERLAIQCETVALPTKGTLTLITGPGKGSKCDWTYTPGPTWNGTDTMTYKMQYTNAAGSRVLTAAAATVNFTGPAVTTVAPKFVPLSPARLLETRPGNVTFDGQQQGEGLRSAGSITEVQITGRATVPDAATAVVLNVTATGTKAAGFLTVFPCGTSTPTASNLNYGNDATIANAVTTKIGTSGKICIYTSAETNLITDINGYYPAGSAFNPLAPARLLETRPGNVTVDGQQAGQGASTAGSITEVQVTGRTNMPTVPNDATAVVVNVTATGTKAPGFLTLFPCGQATPTASNLNYGNDTTIANAVTSKIGAGGKICIYTSSETNLITDINGYYPAGSTFAPLSPARLLETRPGNVTFDGAQQGAGPSPAGSITEVQITGRATVPNDATAVVLNVTATGTKAPGFLTVFPCGQNTPTASNLNYGNGSTIANAVTTKIGLGGKICIYTSAETNLITDIDGYYPA